MADTQRWQYSYEGVIDANGALRVTHVDEDLQDLVGYTLEELAHPNAWLALVPREDEAHTREMVERTIAEHRYSGKLRIVTRSGRSVILEFESDLQDTPGGTVLRGRARDVTRETRLETALREREARLRALGERVPLVMWTTDRELHLTWISGSSDKVRSGAAEAYRGVSIYDLFGGPGSAELPVAAAQRALQGDAATYEVEWNGHVYRATVEPYLDELGTITGTLGVAIDVTELAQTSEEVRTVAREAAAIRARKQSIDEDHPEAIALGSLWIDPEEFVVRKAGREVHLTVTEFKLLLEFARRPGRVLTPQVLVERVWGYESAWSRSSVAMAVKRLRAKIEDDPAHPRLIETVRGVGYRLRAA